MNKILLVFFVFCFILINFVGCHMRYDHQKSIQNNTCDTIIFYFSDISYFANMKDNIVICYPYSENIFEYVVIDYAKDNPCHPYMENRTELIITVTTNSGRALKKDIKKNSNWRCAENSRALWKVVFEINEEDLE